MGVWLRMKCNRCPALYDCGTYDDPDPCCKIFGYDSPPECFCYKEYEGCKLHPKEIDKLCYLIDDMESKSNYYEFFLIEDGMYLKDVSKLTVEEKNKYEKDEMEFKKACKRYNSYQKQINKKYGYEED